MNTHVRLLPDSDLVTVDVTLRNQPGGEVYDVAQIFGSRGPVGRTSLMGRRDVASANGADGEGQPISDSMVGPNRVLVLNTGGSVTIVNNSVECVLGCN